MSVHSKPYLTAEDYLALERESEIKSEYLDGEMVAMAGASEEHNLIVLNVLAELRQQLKERPCRAYPSDMRVHVPATGLYTYPDGSVVCGEPRFDRVDVDTLLNPTLIVEVLSPTTESYDRGKKFEHYRALDSLAEYLLVSQDELLVEQFVRQTGGTWLFTATAGREGVVQLPSIGCTLALSEVYDKVPLA
jgi:Uma2 family endonuclease